MMGTLNQGNEEKVEMDDSGCVEDDSPSKKEDPDFEYGMNGYRGCAELLNLSDDVLLCILQWCSPSDLMALGYTCHRLSTLIRDRTLWVKVPAVSRPVSTLRLKWLLDTVLHENTTELELKGFAEEARGCLGHVDRGEEQENESENGSGDAKPKENEVDDENSSESSTAEGSSTIRQPPYPLFRQHARLHISPHQLPRYSGSPNWYEECADTTQEKSEAGTCSGPKFTITPKLLRELREKCPQLTTLSLQYCNINCAKISISQFPATLKKLSLRGTICFNLFVDKSFLFKIQDYLPLLEDVDVGECSWLEPASLLPLSKLPALRRLVLAHCHRLTEFVAYASLATRYGFNSLQILDLRGSPVGDSEVSSVGWCRSLQELYCSSDIRPPPLQHEHTTRRKCKEYDVECIRGNGALDETTGDHQPGEQVMIEVNLRQREQHQPESEANIEEQGPERDNNIQENGEVPGPSFNVRISGNNGRNVVIRRNYIGSNRNGVDIGRISSNDSRNVSNNATDGSDDDMSSDGEECDETPQKTTKRKVESACDENAKKIKLNNVNEGASTSRVEVNKINNNLNEKTDTKAINNKANDEINNSEEIELNEVPNKVNEPEDDEEQPERPKYQNYVRFRQNQNPVIIRFPNNENRDNLNEGENMGDILGEAYQEIEGQNQGENNQRNQINPNQAEPRHHVLYVNVGHQLHHYRLPNNPIFHSIRSIRIRSQNAGNSGCLLYPPSNTHIDPTSLVSDASVHMFGRADGDHVNYINIGPNGPQVAREHTRPNRSNLRVLCLRGYSNVTDRSLVHLATAAPHLRLVDFTRTNVTEKGVEQFKSLRPDCEVIYSPFKNSE